MMLHGFARYPRSVSQVTGVTNRVHSDETNMLAVVFGVAPSPPPSLALPSASPPPAVSEVDGVRFTLISEQTCEDNKVRWWRYEPEARSMATCARAAAAHEGCGTSIMWSVAAGHLVRVRLARVRASPCLTLTRSGYSYDWGCMCCAPAPLTRAHAYWRIYAFEIPAPLASPSPPPLASPPPPPPLHPPWAPALAPTYLLVWRDQDDCSGQYSLNVTLDNLNRSTTSHDNCNNCWDRCAAGVSSASYQVVGPGKVAIAWNCIGKFSYANAQFHRGGYARTEASGCLHSQGGGAFALCHSATFTGAYGADHYDDMESMCGPAPLPPPTPPPTHMPPPIPPPPPPPYWNTSGPCGQMCRGRPCGEWFGFGAMYCHDFKALGCSCAGCCSLDRARSSSMQLDPAPPPPPPPSPPLPPSPSPPLPPSPSPPPSLALPSASPPPALREVAVDPMRFFTLVSEYSMYSPSPPPPASPVAAGGAVVAFFVVGDESVGGAVVFVAAFVSVLAFVLAASFTACRFAKARRFAPPTFGQAQAAPTVIVGPKDGDGAVLLEAVVLETELKAEPPPSY